MTDIAKIFGETKVETFLGLPKGSLDEIKPGIGILGVPFATPYAVTGTYSAEAPSAIRTAMATYASARDHHDFDLGSRLLQTRNDQQPVEAIDYGDVLLNPDDPETNRSVITSAVQTLRAADAVPVLIGGDDSIPVPVLAAYDGLQSLHVLQIDAHIDWRDMVDGEEQGLSSNMRRASEMKHVTGITQVGARSIGSARTEDVEAATAWGAKLFPMQSVDEFGLDEVISSLPPGGDLFINLDVDSLDPSQMPAVIGPAPGGLAFGQIRTLLAEAGKRCRLVGFALTEFVPERDTSGLAALTAGRLVCNAIGLIARQSSSR